MNKQQPQECGAITTVGISFLEVSSVFIWTGLVLVVTGLVVDAITSDSAEPEPANK